MSEVKPGNTTSEYAVTGSANVWATVATVIGLLVTVGQAIVPAIGGETSTAGVIVGAVIAVLGIAARTLVSLGYVKSRAEVKVANSLENVPGLPELDQ